MEIASYALKLGGVLFLVVAAVGVLRLPDAFTRMHAATKAGTLGAGLVVLGSALALRGGEAIGLAVATLLILLATVPLASHLLGRAAYTSGAPFWRGTARDALEGTLRRGEREGAEDAPSRSPIEPSLVERIVVAPTHGSNRAATTRAGQIAGATGLPVTTLGLIDTAGLDAGACQLARERLERIVSGSHPADPERASVEIREGDPDEAVSAVLGAGDLLVLPATGWYDHGARPLDAGPLDTGPPGAPAPAPSSSPSPAPPSTFPSTPLSGRADTVLALGHRAHRPVLFASERPHVARIVVLDDGSPHVEAGLATLAALDPFPGASVRVTWERGTEETPERRAALTAAAGALDIGFRAPSGDGVLRDDDDLLVCRRVPGAARGDWYGSDWRDRLAPGWRGGVLLV